MKALKTYLFMLLVCSTTLLFSQKENKAIEQGLWEEVSSGVDYTENYKEFNQPKSSKRSPSLNYDWSALKYVFYAIVACLVLFLVYKVLSNVKTNPNIKIQDFSVESLEEIEENLHEINLELLLKEALDQENYQVALRIHFLIVIKLLSEQKHISWAKEKTNWEYYSELKDVLKKDGFKALIIAFEPVWYGEQLLTAQEFEKLRPIFTNYQQQLEVRE